ncbi:MAG: hemolysin family protein [Treponema sp.]
MGNSKPPPACSISLIGLLFSAAVLLILSALFSISESSFLSMNKLRLRIRRKNGDKRAVRAGRLLEKKDVLINTLLAANDLVNILLSSIFAAAAFNLFGEKGVGIAALVTTVLLLVFGEITPKTLSTRNPDSIAYALSGFITVVVTVFKPVSIAFTAVAHAVLILFGVNTKKPKQTFTEEEIKTYIDAAAEDGTLKKDENAMMNRVFKFTDLEAQDIMVPRTRIAAVPNTVTYRGIIEKAQRTRLSRFPVYRSDIDDIIGVIYVKDLLAYKNVSENFLIQNVMRPPLFILGTKKMSSAQQMLRENRQSLAVVIDEYSGTDGIITQDDISREIFGVTGSGSYRRGRIPQHKITDTSDFIIPGNTLLIDLREMLHIPVVSEINETLGGWIEERLDCLPHTNDEVVFYDYAFTVLSVKYRRVDQVRVFRLNPEEEGK